MSDRMGQLKLEERNGELTTVEEKPGQVSGDKLALKASLEAVLFSMGDSVDPESIAQALEVSEETIRNVLDEMVNDYESAERGIRIIRLEGRYQLATKKEQYPVLIRLVRQPRKISLSDVVLETLSIVAYKQPVTRAQIEKIRGVSCDHAINRLLEYGLICEAGRLDAPGRPILFGTTEEFLRHFGTDSLDDLPRISPVKVEDFKTEAEEEAKLKLDI
jgi:segregation and condensation protein B